VDEKLAGTIVAVSRAPKYGFSKPNHASISLIAGLGIEGDVHAGTLVKHRYLIRQDPNMINLRQVHLIPAEVFDEMATLGYDVKAGDLGENVTTRGVDLLNLPLGSRLKLGATAVVEVTGCRSPCLHIDEFQKGLKGAMMSKDAEGRTFFKAGIMGIVLEGGDVKSDDAIEVTLPEQPWQRLPAL
jgi:hypothetical protein